jgi:Transposase.
VVDVQDCSILGLSCNTVETTLRRAPQRNDGESKPRSGRPRTLSERDLRHILCVIRADPYISYRKIKFQTGLTCHSKATFRGLAGTGYGHWLARKRPKLEAKHAKKRYEFACRYKEWDWEQWSKVIFTGECSIKLGSGKRQK